MLDDAKRPIKVFLCHAHSDRASVRKLYSRLTSDGVDAWLDKENLLPGQDWELAIRTSVRTADVVLVCLSKQFNQAGFRQKEVRLALDIAMEKPEGEIFIIPARLEECDTLESLRKWHWVDLFEKNGYDYLLRALNVRSKEIGVKPVSIDITEKAAQMFSDKLLDWEVESAKLRNPNLSNEEITKIQYRIYELRATQSVQTSPLFISYSHADKDFVDKLEKGLNEKGVRFWRDVHDMTSGKMETQIDHAIRQNPTVLLILSKNSMSSDWVQHEVRKARELEKELGHDALCPIALDDDWKSSLWPARVMEQVMEYNILDFSQWKDDATFQAKFAKLLSGLDLFYKKTEV